MYIQCSDGDDAEGEVDEEEEEGTVIVGVRGSHDRSMEGQGGGEGQRRGEGQGRGEGQSRGESTYFSGGVDETPMALNS